MLSRTTKSAAISAAVLAAAALAAIPTGARAADECLTAPKGATPAGAHWYYRLEKGTKRKCWYLADEVSKATRTTSSAATPAAASPETPNPPAAKPKTARKSVADARAELTTPEDDRPPLDATTWPPLESSATANAPRMDSPPAIEPPAASEPVASQPQSWTMATRWPESNSAGAGSSPPDERTAAALRATAAPQEATADPIRIALIVLTAALLAAAIAGRLLLRRVRRAKRPVAPRTIWPDERPRHPDAAADADVEEIESLLRASRSATG